MKSTLISEKEWYERVLKGLNPCNLLNHLEKKSYLQNNLKKKIKIKGNLSGFNTKSLDFFKTWIIIFNLINDIKLVEMDQMGNFFITQAPLTPQALFEILFLSYICCFFSFTPGSYKMLHCNYYFVFYSNVLNSVLNFLCWMHSVYFIKKKSVYQYAC